MDDQKTIKTLRYKTKLDLEEALSKWNVTLPSSRVHARHSVQTLFKQVCEPCQDGSEFVDATVFCETCKRYMCCECKKADEKLNKGKNKHTIVPISLKLQSDNSSKQEKCDNARDSATNEKANYHQYDENWLLSPADHGESNTDPLRLALAGAKLNVDVKNIVTSTGQLAAAESIYIKETFEIDADLDFERKLHIQKDVDHAQVDINDIADTKDESGSEISDGGLSEPEAIDEEEGPNAGHNSTEDDEEVENSSGNTSEDCKHADNDDIITESEETDFITLRQSIDIRYHEYEADCDISDVACLSNGDIVLADTKNERLKVISPMDNKRRYKFDSWPWNIAISCQNEIGVYVTLPDLRQIILININANFEKTKTLPTDADCWGIVSTKEGLFVSLWNADSFSGSIQLLSYDGEALKSLGNESKMPKFLGCPSFLAIDQTETELYATDADSKAMHIIQTDGKLSRQFTYRNADYGCVCGITVGTIGTEEVLYVADMLKKCIYKLAEGNGRKYRSTTILTEADGLEFPRCISFNNLKKTILVSGYTDNIQTFK